MMPIPTVQSGSDGPPGALARPDWRAGGEITAADLRLEQKYLLQRLRRHLRLVHGWGVVCGLNVVAANGGGWDLYICPGYGIGPCGDEILIHTPFRFKLRDYLWTQPVGIQTNVAWIAIEATEDAVAYELAPGTDCCGACGDPREKTSRLADGFRVVVSWTPPLLNGGGFDVCSGDSPPCPVCPETCGLPLASVTLPALIVDNLGGR
jgi:hypothetical protein